MVVGCAAFAADDGVMAGATRGVNGAGEVVAAGKGALLALLVAIKGDEGEVGVGVMGVPLLAVLG